MTQETERVRCYECGTMFTLGERHACAAGTALDQFEILQLAGAAIDDRAGTYGVANQRAAAMWSAYLDRELTERDVCALLVLLKTARLSVTPNHQDSWIDIAGYAQLGGTSWAVARKPEAPDEGS
jgi:hypothetical protein